MNFVGGLHGFSKTFWNLRRRSLPTLSEQAIEAAVNSDIIHLNSLALLPLVNELKSVLGRRCPPISVHVREHAAKTWDAESTQAADQVSGLIFIDEHVKTSFERNFGSIQRIRNTLLPNPIAVSASTAVPTLSSQVETEHHSARIYALTGRIGPGKGFAVACRAFQKSRMEDAQLLVVGKHSGRILRPGPLFEYERIRRFANRNPGSISILGEIPFLGESNFYSKVDVLIRADTIPSAGRNVYEALGSGSRVILSGSEEHYLQDPRIGSCLAQCHFTNTNSLSDIARSLREAHGSEPRRFHQPNWVKTGAATYAETFLKFVLR